MFLAYLTSRILNIILNTHDCLTQTNNRSYFSRYLFRKLSLILVENVRITLFRVTTEWLLIFSTLYSPHRFSVFYTKKEFRGLAPTRATPWTPWRVYSSPHTPSCKKKNDAPIFFLDYPLIAHSFPCFQNFFNPPPPPAPFFLLTCFFDWMYYCTTTNVMFFLVIWCTYICWALLP